MAQSGSIFLDLGGTLYRLGISLLITAGIGIPAGIALGYFSHSYEYVGNIIDFLRSIPPIALYPLLLIAVGIGDESRIGVAVFGSLVVLLLIISRGLYQQSPLRRQYFAALGANTWEVLRDVVWYEALPYIMVALRTATSLAIIVVVVTEMLVGAHYGLGTRVQNVQITSNIPDLFVTLLIIGCIGVLLNTLLTVLERKLITWKVS
jgi:NitT/TauT family transport system permease protein